MRCLAVLLQILPILAPVSGAPPSLAAPRPAPDASPCARVEAPASFEETLALADCLRLAGKAREAIEMYGLALNVRTGGTPALFYGLGAAHEILGEDARALKAFDAAIFRGGGDSNLFYHRGLAKEGLGDYAGALVDFRRTVALKPEDGNAHRNIGYVLLQVDRSEEATVALEEAIRLNPADSKAWLNLGTAYANVDEAVRKELKELRPPLAGQVPADDPQLRRQRELNDKLREFDYRAHALAAYREAVRIEPGNAEYWYNLGTLLHEQRRDVAEAIDALARAAALSAPDYRALRNLANAQKDARRFREALETTDKIAATYGEQDAWLLELRGSLQVELGDLPSAERSYLLAVEADPDGAGPHVGLAILYKRRKLDVESATHLRTAQRLRPELAHYFEMVLQHEP